MQRKDLIADEELGKRAVPSNKPHSLPVVAAGLGFSAEEIKELDRLYVYLETKNAD